MNQSRNNNQAFTLVEILIAVAVLAVSLTAMANLVIVTMRANVANQNTVTAYYLAEQGLEAMRNVRDSNWLQNYGWNLGASLWGADFDCTEGQEQFFLLVDESNDYTVGAVNAPWELTDLSSSMLETGAALYLATDIEGYSYYSHDSSGEETIFNRYIEVVYDSCDEQVAEVSSVVFWNERGIDREIILSTYLTDWQ